MKRWVIAITALLAVAMLVTLAVIVIRNKSVLPPSTLGEIIAPQLITDEAWRASIAEDPSSNEYSGYGILQDRGSDIAIKEGLRDLSSDDPYTWLNAASYLGSFGRTEAIPYLIKALRHTAWRSDEERVEQLRKLTGKSFGNNFEAWHEWYISEPDQIVIDWESSLGFRPRLPKIDNANKAKEPTPNPPSD